MASERLSGICYYGGKSVLATQGVGSWVASLLPASPGIFYIEPFAGMLGVLLQRRPARSELVSDSNHDIVNWWRCIRDEPHEFARLLDATPYSRDEFVAACRFIHEAAPLPPDGAADLRRGLAFHTIVNQGRMKTGAQASRPNNFTFRYNANPPVWGHDRVTGLATRLKNVQLESRDACAILERVAAFDNALVYCDPPYRTSDIRHYEAPPVDWDRLTDLLLAQTGRVAISGYHDEWDHLPGWQRYEYQTFCSVADNPAGELRAGRTERLWTNYAADTGVVQQALL